MPAHARGRVRTSYPHENEQFYCAESSAARILCTAVADPVSRISQPMITPDPGRRPRSRCGLSAFLADTMPTVSFVTLVSSAQLGQPRFSRSGPFLPTRFWWLSEDSAAVELLEQRLGLLKDRRVEALGKPAVDRR